MAFEIKKGIILNVHKASAGLKKDGTPWALITCQENENQPEGLEFPSQSKYTIKFWMDQLPEGATNGCCVKLVDFDGHRHTRDCFERLLRTGFTLRAHQALDFQGVFHAFVSFPL